MDDFIEFIKNNLFCAVKHILEIGENSARFSYFGIHCIIVHKKKSYILLISRVVIC